MAAPEELYDRIGSVSAGPGKIAGPRTVPVDELAESSSGCSWP